MTDNCYDIGRLTEFLDHFARASRGTITPDHSLRFRRAPVAAAGLDALGRDVLDDAVDGLAGR